uniref:Uncharacterized protein n=1 Tax=Romanomermis culicivorax TaxID=13658 RepID=A0A915IHW2_ROMCU
MSEIWRLMKKCVTNSIRQIEMEDHIRSFKVVSLLSAFNTLIKTMYAFKETLKNTVNLLSITEPKINRETIFQRFNEMPPFLRNEKHIAGFKNAFDKWLTEILDNSQIPAKFNA